MELVKKYLNQLKGLAPFYLFLIAVLPISFLILIHSCVRIDTERKIEHDNFTTTGFKSVKDDALGFQKTDGFIERNVEQNRPVVPYHLFEPVGAGEDEINFLFVLHQIPQVAKDASVEFPFFDQSFEDFKLVEHQ